MFHLLFLFINYFTKTGQLCDLAHLIYIYIFLKIVELDIYSSAAKPVPAIGFLRDLARLLFSSNF